MDKMATIRVIDAPPELALAPEKVLSPDGKSVACRVEGGAPGLYLFELGNPPRPLKLDGGGAVYRSPSWTAAGDLLFRVDVQRGPQRVGVVPAFGRGSGREYEGSSIGVDPSGRVVAVAGAGSIRAYAAQEGNSPFGAALGAIASLDEPNPPTQAEITRDGAFALVVRSRVQGEPSLWSFPIGGGDAQEITQPLQGPASLSFALSKDLLAVMEIRQGASITTRLFVRPIAAGSLGALRLGPARDLLFARQIFPAQKPAFSPDGKKIAVVASAVPPLPGAPPGGEMALDLLPASGGKAIRATQARELRGSPHFLESGEVAVDGLDRISIVTI